jgi:hypothetical protein
MEHILNRKPVPTKKLNFTVSLGNTPKNMNSLWSSALNICGIRKKDDLLKNFTACNKAENFIEISFVFVIFSLKYHLKT